MYVDSSEIIADDIDFIDQFDWLSKTAPYSASFTGSFEIDSTTYDGIMAGHRWQLRIRGHEDYSIGYQTPPRLPCCRSF